MNRMPGAARIGRFRGAPIFLHWSFLLGALFFANGLVPGRLLAFFLVVLAHELGHAVLVRRHRLRVIGIALHGMGGECVYEGPVGARAAAAIAWGGVLGQLALFSLGLVADVLGPFPRSPFLVDLLGGLVRSNNLVAAFNLLPIPGFDGAKAWSWLRLRRAEEARRRRRAEAQMQQRANDLARRFDALDGIAADAGVRQRVEELIASVREPQREAPILRPDFKRRSG